jgi:hypothetical protein
MAISPNAIMTSPVRTEPDERLKIEQPANQTESPTGPKRSSVWLERCLWLVVGLLLAGGVVWLVVIIRREKAARLAQDNFRKIAIAFQDHADTHGEVMPTQAIYDKQTGKPLLSWRVTILPQLGEAELFKQIHLDEPWDSPHNRQFWDKMPKVYELPGLPASGGLTAIQVFMGPETPFSGHEGRFFPRGFPDGTSQTILLAEAARAVNWMQPKDIDMYKVDPDDIRASLGDRTGKGSVLGMADGSSRFLQATVSNMTLKAVITPEGNDLVNSCGQ